MSIVKIIADVREREQSRVALIEDGRLAEVFIDFNDEDASVRQGDIFKARVETLVPSISAAFVKLSKKTHGAPVGSNNAFMYTSNPLIKPGHEILVQVVHSARKNKAPRVTPSLSIPGRWLVLVPGGDEASVSRRISDQSERKRLKDLAELFCSELDGNGLIIRTAAEGISEEYLRSDLKSLLTLWGDIKARSSASPAPCLLYRDMGAIGRVLRDEVAGEIDEIVIDDAEDFEAAKTFIERFYPKPPSMTLYDGSTPVFEYFGIEDEIRKALDRKVWLKSGAYLVIDQTEALTVIDVNTGKFTSAPDMRQTVLAVNKEAAEEIARQLRLRSIGGIIVVDFVDMEREQDRHELLRHFETFLRHDRMKPKVFSITRLGLVELTRKRERPDLKSILTRNCPVCGDNGYIEREENIAVSIKRFIRKVTSANGAEAFLIETDVHMAKYIHDYICDWEEEFGRRIFIVGNGELSRGKYRLEFQGSLDEVLKRIN